MWGTFSGCQRGYHGYGGRWQEVGEKRASPLPGLKFSQAHIHECVVKFETCKRKCIFSTFSCVSGSVLGTVCKAYARQSPFLLRHLSKDSRVGGESGLLRWGLDPEGHKAFTEQSGGMPTSPSAALASASFYLKASS